MAPRRITTLADIAAKAGVSKSTVSLALRGDKRVTQATKDLVAQTAAKLDYRPDPLVARMAARRWQTPRHTINVAYLINRPFSTHSRIPGESNTPELTLDGIKETADQLGYHVEPLALSEYSGAKPLMRVLTARNIRGIILGNIRNPAALQAINWSQFSVVGCISSLLNFNFDRIDANPFDTMTAAYLRAKNAGYRRIAFATFDESVSQDERMRQAAYVYSQSANDTDLGLPLFKALPNESIDQSELPFIRWLQDSRPDCIIGTTSIFSWWLQKHDYRQPQDIGFIALMDNNQLINRTRFEIPYRELGTVAMKTLDSAIRLNQCGAVANPKTIFIDSVWCPGTTIRIKQ